jgi:hypothetical protein
MKNGSSFCGVAGNRIRQVAPLAGIVIMVARRSSSQSDSNGLGTSLT